MMRKYKKEYFPKKVALEEVFKIAQAMKTLKNLTAKTYIKQNSTPCLMKDRSVPLTIREKVETDFDRTVAPFLIKPLHFSEWSL